jgi:hypothetical protein
MRSILSILLLSCITLTAMGQWIEDPAIDAAIRRGIDATYAMRFDAAEREFQTVIKSYPDHPAGYFFDAMIDWWRILIAIEREDGDEAFYRKLDKIIEMCDERLDRSDRDLTALFFKGGAIGFRGRLLATRKSWVRAAADGKAALPIVLDAARYGRNNPDIDLGTGIYNYYAAVLPERYSVLKPLMFFLPKGDRTRGLRQLKNAAEHARFANWEAMYFLVQSYGAYENQPNAAIPYARRLCEAFPENPVFQRSLAKLYVRAGDWQNARAVFTSIRQNVARSLTGYSRTVHREALYYLGYEAMVRGDYAESMTSLIACDALSRAIDIDGPSSYMVMANLRMGMLHDVMNQRAFAIKQYDKVLRMDDFNGSHDLAKGYKQIPYRLN